MKNQNIFIIIAIALLSAAAYLGIAVFGERSVDENITGVEEEVDLIDIQDEDAVDEDSVQQEEPEPHPVSLPAYFDRKLDGRDLNLGEVLADNRYYTRYYIEYLSGGLKISGVMNVPKGQGPWPVLILNHGYIDPEVYTNGRGLKREQDYLARNGFIVIHPDYRNHAQSDREETESDFRLGYTEDVINAVLAVRGSDMEIFDKDNIGMLGHSMGGGVAMNAMVIDPDLVKAVVLFAPVHSLAEKNYHRWTADRQEVVDFVEETYGRPEDNPEFWANISAATFFDRVEVPVLLHQGTADKDVPAEWSDDLDNRLTEAGKDITYHVYPGEGHEFAAAWPTVMKRTLNFFQENLR